MSKTVTISENDLNAAVETLSKVGFPTDDHYGFSHHVRNEESYFSNTLEWTERFKGIRVWVRKNHANEVTSIMVLDHGYTTYTDEDFAAVNKEIEAIFAK